MLHKTYRLDSTPIFIGDNMQQRELFNPYIKKASSVVVITDDQVFSALQESIEQFFLLLHPKTLLITIPAGEASKTREVKQSLEDKLLAAGLDRSGVLIAIGGGVITDLVGFVAATFCRGVDFISIPTTLLAMVDASIGGKTGVNTPFGKNLIGSFYFPKAVYVDIAYLKTLPEKEKNGGFVEVIKAALVYDPSLAKSCFNEGKQLLNNPKDLLEVISRAIAIKMSVVLSDQKELKGKRRILNFGHTLGHAIEQLSGYTFSHGEAVAIGMVAAAYISHKLCKYPKEDINKLVALLKNLDVLPIDRFQLDANRLVENMIYDKKTVNQTIRFVLLKKTGVVDSGDGAYCRDIERDLILEAIDFVKTL